MFECEGVPSVSQGCKKVQAPDVHILGAPLVPETEGQGPAAHSGPSSPSEVAPELPVKETQGLVQDILEGAEAKRGGL